MPVRFQLVIDCADPDRLARFWAAALGYELAPPPVGFSTWQDFYRDLGLPEDDVVDGADRISDPDGSGPRIWFNVVPDAKRGKNRLHWTSAPVASGRTLLRRADSGWTQRPDGWPAWGPSTRAHSPRRSSTTTRSE